MILTREKKKNCFTYIVESLGINNSITAGTRAEYTSLYFFVTFVYVMLYALENNNDFTNHIIYKRAFPFFFQVDEEKRAEKVFEIVEFFVLHIHGVFFLLLIFSSFQKVMWC